MGYTAARSAVTLTRVRLRRVCSTLYPTFSLRRNVLRPVSVASVVYVLSLAFAGFYLVVVFSLLPRILHHHGLDLITLPHLLFFLFLLSNMLFSYVLAVMTDPGRVPPTWKPRSYQLEYSSAPNITVPSQQHQPSSPVPSHSAGTLNALSNPPSVAISLHEHPTSQSVASQLSAETVHTSTQRPPSEVTPRQERTLQDGDTSGEIHRSLDNSCEKGRKDVQKLDCSPENMDTPTLFPVAPNEVSAAGTSMRRPDGRFRFCSTCEIFKPDRAHHCGVCGVCVLQMDHHCPFMGNTCIGLHNRKFFVLFLYYATFSAWSVTFLSWRDVFDYMFVDYPTSDYHPELQMLERMYPSAGPVVLRMLVGMMYLAVTVHGLALTPFAAYHTRLVFKNRTTLETLESPANHIHADLLASSDRDLRTHWKAVFGRASWAWFLPITYGRDPDNDGIRSFQLNPPSQLPSHVQMLGHPTKTKATCAEDCVDHDTLHPHATGPGKDRGEELV